MYIFALQQTVDVITCLNKISNFENSFVDLRVINGGLCLKKYRSLMEVLCM